MGEQVRTSDEILKNPQLGETLPSRLLGYRGRKRRIWLACPSCRRQHWVFNTTRERNNQHCNHCCHSLSEHKRYRADATGVYKTIRATDIPKDGDLIRSDELDRKGYRVYRWTPCPDCDWYRWVRWTPNNNCSERLCINCIQKSDYKAHGEKSGKWRGGRSISKGYVFVRINRGSPYYSMTTRGRVPEHRLVMAEHLGRPLVSWEIVHHKHTKYPAGSVEDKQDNRIENLELMHSVHSHNTITILEKRLRYLESQVERLATTVKLSRWRIKELEARNSVLESYSASK